MKFKSLPKVLVALFATCLLSYVFIACKDVKTVPLQEQSKQQTKEITVENGRLKFVDEKHFKETFDELMNNQNMEYLKKWESKFQNYISMKQAYKNLTEADMVKIAESKSNKGYEGFLTIIQDKEDKEAIRNTEHPIHSLLFNKEGIVLVGKNAYKFEYNRILKVNNYNSSKIDALLDGKINSEIQVIPFKINKVAVINKNLRAKGVEDLDRECHDAYGSNNNRAFAAYFILYGQVGVNLFGWDIDIDGAFSGYFSLAKHRRRLFGVWFNHDAPSLKLEGQFLYFNGSNNQLVNVDGNCENCSEVASAYFWGGDYPATGWVKSSGEGNDNQQHGCQVSK